MMLGRDLLGKLVMLVFVLFNLSMLGLMGIAYKFKNTPSEEIRAAALAKAIEFYKDRFKDDRKLSAKDMGSIELAVDDIMQFINFAQQHGMSGLLVQWAIGIVILSVPLYFTRPQPI